MRLPDGGAVRLTVQQYFTPAGRCIQKPYDEGVDAYRREKYERFERGELMSLDSLDLPDSLQYKTKVLGRTVYGGGGILPDVFVPIDTSLNSVYFTDLLRRGLFNRAVLEYVDGNRPRLEQQLADRDDFVQNHRLEQELLDGLVALGKGEDIPFVEADWNTSLPAIELRLGHPGPNPVRHHSVLRSLQPHQPHLPTGHRGPPRRNLQEVRHRQPVIHAREEQPLLFPHRKKTPLILNHTNPET